MSYLPSDTGMAFVLVQHLDPKHHSILTEFESAVGWNLSSRKLLI